MQPWLSRSANPSSTNAAIELSACATVPNQIQTVAHHCHAHEVGTVLDLEVCGPGTASTCVAMQLPCGAKPSGPLH
jgi:hypothetical protein